MGVVMAHSTKCLREACEVMGCQLISIKQFYHNALIFLTSNCDSLTISGNDAEGWVVEMKTATGMNAIGGDDDLTSALCGMVHTVPTLRET